MWEDSKLASAQLLGERLHSEQDLPSAENEASSKEQAGLALMVSSLSLN